MPAGFSVQLYLQTVLPIPLTPNMKEKAKIGSWSLTIRFTG